MKIDVLTLFPGMFKNVLGESIIKRAGDKGLVEIELHDLRDWTHDNHRSADDKPFGGGAGMVIKIEPVCEALGELIGSSFVVRRSSFGKNIRKTKDERRTTKVSTRVVLLTPQGKKLDQKLVRKLAANDRLVLICGHYEGFDERIRELVDEEVSIGDYVLTCGEIPAMVLIDSIVRLVPGVLGDDRSNKFESFEDELLEHPHYTRPADFKGMKVPQVLLSGDHKKIEEWRKAEALKRTKSRRPDLTKRRR